MMALLREGSPTGFMKPEDFAAAQALAPSRVANILFLAGSDPASINDLDIDGRSALHWAARYPSEALIEGLLNLGANPLASDGRDRFIALSEGAQYLRGPSLKILTLASGGTETPLRANRTALLEAAFNSNDPGVVELLALGANPAATDDQGHGALHLLCFGKKSPERALPILMSLARAGCSLDLLDHSGQRPLDVAERYGSCVAPALRALIEAQEIAASASPAKAPSKLSGL